MLELNFTPFPELQTERMVLRRITMDDAEDLWILRTDVDAMRYLDRKKPKTISEIHELILKIENGIKNNDAVGWGMSLKNQSRIIGHIGYHRIEKEHFRAEIGYLLHPAHWNKGFASEAMKAIIDFGFNRMNLHSIEANVNPDNNQSLKLLKKHNFLKEAYFKENYFFNGKFIDTEIYSLIKS